MNINKKKTILSIVLVLAIITAIVGIVFAVNNTTDTIQAIKVSVEKDEANDKKIYVKIENEDEGNQENKNSASITSFQIGLNVNVSNDAEITFTFDDKLNNSTKALADYNYDKANKKLYIYYTGEKELNDLQSSEILNIGYITINTTKETEVKISPIDGFSTTSSIDYSGTNLVSGQSLNYRVASNNPSGSETEQNPSGSSSQDPNKDPDEDSGDNLNQTSGGISSPEPGQNGGSSSASGNNAEEKGSTDGNKTIIDKVIAAAKTGANHSITRILIPLAILIVVAFVLIYLKTRMKPRKH